jgi:hypothetical protein
MSSAYRARSHTSEKTVLPPVNGLHASTRHQANAKKAPGSSPHSSQRAAKLASSLADAIPWRVTVATGRTRRLLCDPANASASTRFLA